MASPQRGNVSTLRCFQNQYSTLPTTNRTFVSVASDTALVDQNERHNDDINNPSNDPTTLTAKERGVRDHDVISKVNSLQADLPEVVDQILTAHAQASTKSRNNMLRAKWERALRAEMHDHKRRDRSLRFSRADASRLERYSSSAMRNARLGPSASAPTFWSSPESPSTIDSEDAMDQPGAGVEDENESSSIWNRISPSAENHSWANVDNAAQDNKTRWDVLGLVSSSEGNRSAEYEKLSPTGPAVKAEKHMNDVASVTAAIQDLSEQEQMQFSQLATGTEYNDGCSPVSQRSTNSQADEAFCGGENYGNSAASIVPVDKTVLKQSVVSISNSPLAMKSTPDGMIREREELSDRSKKPNDDITQAVVLLRLMSDDDWRTFTNYAKDMEENERHAEEPHDGYSAVSLKGADYGEHDIINDYSLRGGGKRITKASIKSILDLQRSQSVATNSTLSTSEYNSTLARVALSHELSADDVLDLLMQFHSQMEALAQAGVTEAQPDPTTYEIILLTLYHRLAANDDAFRIIQRFMISTKTYWTSHTLEAAMLIFRKQNATKVALKLFDELQTEGSAEIDITLSAYRSLVHLTQFHDDRKPAIVVLQHALRVSRSKMIS